MGLIEETLPPSLGCLRNQRGLGVSAGRLPRWILSHAFRKNSLKGRRKFIKDNICFTYCQNTNQDRRNIKCTVCKRTAHNTVSNPSPFPYPPKTSPSSAYDGEINHGDSKLSVDSKSLWKCKVLRKVIKN